MTARGSEVDEAGALAVAGLDGEAVRLAQRELDGLRAQLDGPVLLAGDAGWDDAVEIWNAMAATVPAVVVQPASTVDVATAVGFARDRRLLLSVKGGGHHIAGTALAEGCLTLDMSRLRDVTVDAGVRLADVGAGCRLAEVDQATQAHGLATVLGFISDTGVAGLTLGGGFGYLTRRFGWTVDNLEAVEVVTADGRIRRASRTENADLFWALRGAGANFGVVTRFTFRLHEVGPTVYGGLIAWPFERAAEILAAYRDITAASPRELTVFLNLLRAPPAPFVPDAWHGRRICAMCVCYSGDVDRADEVLAPIRAMADPVVDLLEAQPYVAVQSYLDDGEPRGQHYYWKTELLAGLDDGLLSTMAELFAGCPIPDGQIGLLQIGGALNDRDADDGSIANRGARFAFGLLGMWEPGDAGEDRFRDWIRDAWAQVRPFSTGATYINFQTADEDAGRIRATYGANHERLVALKRRYHPDLLFQSRFFLTYGVDGASPGDSTPMNVDRDQYSVLPLDELVVQLVADELEPLRR